jgi:hypothetical protein
MDWLHFGWFLLLTKAWRILIMIFIMCSWGIVAFKGLVFKCVFLLFGTLQWLKMKFVSLKTLMELMKLFLMRAQSLFDLTTFQMWKMCINRNVIMTYHLPLMKCIFKLRNNKHCYGNHIIELLFAKVSLL